MNNEHGVPIDLPNDQKPANYNTKLVPPGIHHPGPTNESAKRCPGPQVVYKGIYRK